MHILNKASFYKRVHGVNFSFSVRDRKTKVLLLMEMEVFFDELPKDEELKSSEWKRKIVEHYLVSNFSSRYELVEETEIKIGLVFSCRKQIFKEYKRPERKIK